MHAFEIAAEPVRRRIIEVLAVDDHAVGELTDLISTEFAVSRSAVSHHLRILRDHGAVIVETDPVDVRLRSYRLDPRYLGRLDDAVAELFVLWDHRYGSSHRRIPIGLVPPSREPRMHRAGRAGHRGRRGDVGSA
jgi:DNA-binding transcriptional ArsR family regulator